MKRTHFFGCLFLAAFHASPAHAASNLDAVAPITMVPEAERGFQQCVLGLNPADGNYFMLPPLAEARQPSPDFDRLKERLYWTDFENSHGTILKKLPENADLYVSYPDPQKFPAGHGQARSYLREYLARKAKWSQARMDAHLHFFKVSTALIWPQDAGEVLGTDAKGRLVLGWGPEDWDVYHATTESLAKEFPKRFALKRLEHGVSAEGGDLAVVRRPDGQVGLVIGRHRVLQYLKVTGAGDYSGKSMPQELIERATNAYQRSYGVPVQVVPVAPLREGWGDEELFHLDMVAAFLKSSGAQHCMVPDMNNSNVDALSGAAYSGESWRAVDREYDQVAAELAQSGYVVSRLPLADNPVRSPSNTLKELDPSHNRDVVYLARYPQQIAGNGSLSAESVLKQKFEQLNRCAEDWNNGQNPEKLQALVRSVEDLRHEMKASTESPNPAFEAQAQAYRDAGCEVVEVSDYPWGAGSLHCQWLH